MNVRTVLAAFRTGIVAITLLSFTACTTLVPIRNFTPSKIQQQVHRGDRASIVWRNGAEYILVITTVDADALHGRADNGKNYKILYEDIRSIEVEKPSGWQMATGFGAVVTVGVIALLISLFRLTDPSSGGESGGSGSRD